MYNPYAYINQNGNPQQGNDPYAGAGYHANQNGGYYPMNDAYGRLGYMRYSPPGTLPKELQTEHQGYTSFPPHPLGQQGYAPQGYPSYHGGYPGGYPEYHGNGQFPPTNNTGDHGNPSYALQQQYIQQARAQHYRTQQNLPQQLPQPTPPAGEKGFGASVFRAAGAGNVGNDYNNSSSAQSQHCQQLDPSAASYNPQSQLPSQAPQGTKRGFGSMINAAGGKLFGNDHGKPANPRQYQPQYQPQPYPQQQPQQGESAAYYNAPPQQPVPAAPGSQKGLGSSILGASGGGLMSSSLGAGVLGTAGGTLAGAAGMNMAHKLHKKHRSHSHHRRSAPSSGSSSSSSSSSSNSSGSSS